MNKDINWKLFLILLVASVIGSSICLALSPALARVFTPFVLFAQLIQTIIDFSIAIFIGLYLAKRVGFGLLVIEGWLESVIK